MPHTQNFIQGYKVLFSYSLPKECVGVDSRRETVKSCGVCEFASCDTTLFAPCSASVAANIFFSRAIFQRNFPHVSARQSIRVHCQVLRFSHGVFNFLTHPSLSAYLYHRPHRREHRLNFARWLKSHLRGILIHLYNYAYTIQINNIKLYYCHFIISTKLILNYTVLHCWNAM